MWNTERQREIATATLFTKAHASWAAIDRLDLPLAAYPEPVAARATARA